MNRPSLRKGSFDAITSKSNQRDSTPFPEFLNMRGTGNTNRPMHHSGLPRQIKGSGAGVPLLPASPRGNVRNRESKYGAATSLWTGSEQMEAPDG